MTSLAANLALIALWLALHTPTFRWLGEAWLRDEGQLHLVLAVLVGGWLMSKAAPAHVLSALRRPLRHSTAATLLTLGPLLAARLGPDLNALHASLALVSAWGLFGLFATPATWRASAGPSLLLAAVLPVTGHLDVLLGYPLRRALASTVAALTGAVDAGTVLAIDGRLAHVDLPCSGVRGLWSATVLLLGACVVWGRRLGAVSGMAIAIAIALQLLQNLVRVAALVGLTTIDPFLADITHTPMGVVGFVLALVAPFAVVASAPAVRQRPPTTLSSRAALVAPVVAVLLLGAGLLRRPESPVAPAPVVAAPALWQPLPVEPAESAFLLAHGGQLTKAQHPSGAQVALVSSRSWLAHHVPEQCHEAGGWTLHDDHAAPIGGHLVRVARATKGPLHATALWWFRSHDQVTDDHTVRIRAGWTDDAPWVLVSLLVPGHTDPADPALATLIAELDAAAATALEIP